MSKHLFLLAWLFLSFFSLAADNSKEEQGVKVTGIYGMNSQAYENIFYSKKEFTIQKIISVLSSSFPDSCKDGWGKRYKYEGNVTHDPSMMRVYVIGKEYSDPSCTKPVGNNTKRILTVSYKTVMVCKDGYERDEDTGECLSHCEQKAGEIRPSRWASSVLGEAQPPFVCSPDNCVAQAVGGSECYTNSGDFKDCYGDYKITSTSCTRTDENNPYCTTATCSGDEYGPVTPDPTPDPNPDTGGGDSGGGIPDPTPFPDGHGSAPGDSELPPDTTDPIKEPEPETPNPEPEKPDPTPTENVGSEETTKAITNLNSDLNENFADVNHRLSVLAEMNDAINRNLSKQLQQDYEIYQKMKKQMDTNTEYLGDRIDASGNAIYNQIGKLNHDLVKEVDSVGNQISGKIDGLGEKVDGLGDEIGEGLDGIADKICDPREENCEGEHGLTGNDIENMFGQLQGSLEGQADGAEKGLMDELNKIANKPVVSTEEPNAIKDMIMRAFPDIGNCRSLHFRAGGRDIEIDCRFSTEFKMLFSWVLYIATAMTLFDIATGGITPSASQHIRRSV